MVTIAGNPVLSTPDGAGLARALEGLDFMVAIDIYLNETTRHADVILPPTSALERDQYDLVFHGFAVRNTARFTPAVFAKPDDARHDWEIFGDLTERVQSRLGVGLKDRLAIKARFAPSPATWSTGLLKTGGRTTMRALRKQPGGRRPRPAAADDARAAADRRQADRPRARAGRRRPRPGAGARRRDRPAEPTASCCSSAGGTSRTATPGCTTPSGSPAAGRATTC